MFLNTSQKYKIIDENWRFFQNSSIIAKGQKLIPLSISRKRHHWFLKTLSKNRPQKANFLY